MMENLSQGVYTSQQIVCLCSYVQQTALKSEVAEYLSEEWRETEQVQIQRLPPVYVTH